MNFYKGTNIEKQINLYCSCITLIILHQKYILYKYLKVINIQNYNYKVTRKQYLFLFIKFIFIFLFIYLFI
jgi:hypothetical protein